MLRPLKMQNEPGELDHAETVVSFWAIDETLGRIRRILKEIADLCEPKDE
jgi:hypothetical protein